MTATMSLPGSRRGQIQSVQILRFFGALLVVIGHSQHELFVRAGGNVGGLTAAVPFDWGVGVDIFFVISGFVMMFVTQGQFGKAGASREFLRRRIIRVVPMYWLFTTPVMLAVLWAGFHGGEAIYWPNLVFSYLFLPGPRCGEYCFPVFSLGWTLNYEMLFYVLFAISMFLRQRAGLLLVAALIVALIVAGQLAPVEWTMLRFWGSPIIGEFLAGIGIAALFVRGVRVPRGLGWAMVAMGLIAAMAFYQSGSYDFLWRLITGGVPAVLVVSGAVLSLSGKQEWRVGRWLAIGGDASYILYLCHPYAIKGIAAFWGKVGLFGAAAPLFVPSAVAGAVVLSLALHRWVEKPVVRRLNRYGQIKAPAPPLTSAHGEQASTPVVMRS